MRTVIIYIDLSRLAEIAEKPELIETYTSFESLLSHHPELPAPTLRRRDLLPFPFVFNDKLFIKTKLHGKSKELCTGQS